MKALENVNNIESSEYGDFYVIDDTAKEKLGVEGVSQTVLVKINLRKVVSYLGLNYNNTFYWTLDELNEFYNVEYNDKNTENPTLNELEVINISPISWKIKVKDATYKGYTSFQKLLYKEENVQETKEVYYDYVDIKKPGKYIISVVDTAGNTSNSKSVDLKYDYVSDGLLVYYDGENNTGTGHSATATTWRDLSGNNNDATLNGFDNTAESGWHSNYLAFDGKNDFAEKTGIVVDGANGTIEIVGKYLTEGKTDLYMLRSLASGGRTYIKGGYITKGNPTRDINFNTDNLYNLSSRVLKYYTENGTSYTFNYYNMEVSGEPQIYQSIDNGNYISIGSFVNTNWEQGPKMQVNAVRVYNRALTEDEIRQNYEIDKARFGI